MADIDKAPPQGDAGAPLPPDLRFLKTLVTVLTATMIGGVIAIVGLLVTRLPGPATLPALPDGVRLPEGDTAQAVTFGPGWIAVVTTGGDVLVLDGRTGALRQRVRIAP